MVMPPTPTTTTTTTLTITRELNLFKKSAHDVVGTEKPSARKNFLFLYKTPGNKEWIEGGSPFISKEEERKKRKEQEHNLGVRAYVCVNFREDSFFGVKAINMCSCVSAGLYKSRN